MSTDERGEALIEIDIAIQGRTVNVRDRVFGRDNRAVVTRDTETDGVYVGVPAKRVPGKNSLDVTLGDTD